MHGGVQKNLEKRTNNSLHIEWVDVVKGILMIMMIFGHNIQFGSGAEMLKDRLYFEDRAFRFIYSFHMPCLMLISGYFFGFSISKKGLWIRRIQTVVIPTLIWSSIPASVPLVKTLFSYNFSVSVIYEVGVIALNFFWFMWAILFSVFFVWLVHQVFDDKMIFYIGIGIAFLFVPDWQTIALWKFMYPYFTVGYLWNIKRVSFSKFDEHKMAVTLVLLTVFIALFSSYDTDSFIYTTGIKVETYKQLMIDLYRYIIGFIGSAMMIWIVYTLYPYIRKNIRKVLGYCGSISFSIYILDSLINRFIISKITKGFSLDYRVVLMETIVVVICCSMIDYFIKKFLIARKLLLGNR